MRAQFPRIGCVLIRRDRSERNPVEKEEKCVYETFVTNCCGIAAGGRRNCRQVGTEEKCEYETFVTIDARSGNRVDARAQARLLHIEVAFS